MAQFDDARQLVNHCKRKFPELNKLHAECLTQHVIKHDFLIEVKNCMENLRSALDYCAVALFMKYGKSKKSNPKIYFPYVNQGVDRLKFQETVERCIPGLPASRPDIVDLLATYQYFGNTGNWLSVLIIITNENKHEQLTPQVQKEYLEVIISGTLQSGESVKIDLTNIPLGGGPDKPFHAEAGTWSGLEFINTGVLVMPLLEYAVPNVMQIVNELSAI